MDLGGLASVCLCLSPLPLSFRIPISPLILSHWISFIHSHSRTHTPSLFILRLDKLGSLTHSFGFDPIHAGLYLLSIQLLFALSHSDPRICCSINYMK